jgi:hypothetical protein
MANEEHVAILKKGVATWNAWRDENPTIRPNLFAANLSEANLRWANLGGADLCAATSAGRTSTGRISAGRTSGRRRLARAIPARLPVHTAPVPLHRRAMPYPDRRGGARSQPESTQASSIATIPRRSWRIFLSCEKLSRQHRGGLCHSLRPLGNCLLLCGASRPCSICNVDHSPFSAMVASSKVLDGKSLSTDVTRTLLKNFRSF